ncbi:MAG: hypothetical protein R2795_07610 [Saprospiraceae bacterium]
MRGLHLRYATDIPTAVERADVIIMGVPSHSFRQTLQTARHWIRP